MLYDVEFENAAREALMPPPSQSVTDWAAQHLSLSARTSSFPGRYSTMLTPYVREPLDRTGQIGVKSITCCWAVQTSKTTMMMASLAWRIARKPTPALWAMPSESLARSFSRDRLQPLIDDCPTLASEKPEDPDRFQNLEMQMRKMTLYLCGAGSASSASSRSIGALYLDEIDKMPEESKREAGMLALFELRTRNFPSGMVFKTSTPTLDTGAVWTAFLTGDQRYFVVACPSCHHQQKLEWEQVRWSPEAKLDDKWDFKQVAASTHLLCKGCSLPWGEEQKNQILRSGRWIAENPDAPRGVHSYHLNALYSPWVSWGELAVQFLQDKESPGGLRNFLNSSLAQPWVPQASTIKSGEIEALVKSSPDYRLGSVPIADPEILIMTVDVQQTELWWLIRALGPDQASYLIDYGTVVGWEAIRELFRKEWPTSGGGSVRCRFGLVDSGYAARSAAGVYDFVSSWPKTWAAYKGRTVSQGMRHPVIFGEILSRDQLIPLYQADDDLWKERLYLQTIQKQEGRWHLPRDIRRDYVTQLTGERLVERKGLRGQRSLEWARVGANHLGDCEKMWLVAAGEYLKETSKGSDQVEITAA